MDSDDLFNVFEDDAKKQPSAHAAKGPIKRPISADVGDQFLISEDEPSTKTSKLDEDILLFDEKIPRLKIHRIETLGSCTHEVAVPPDQEYVPLRAPTTPAAKEYPFVLDAFQKEALLVLENQQSVLVSAHTSAGKTVVAQYAIALALRDKQRVIYTSPIKALSNQKYRELYEDFQDVGLMTGDVTINPTASCLVMTTEILRSMLYRGSEVTREVAWVIFDEIHYMRDSERGVVWEETIILLPDNVHYVFLSATIPNARQFAEWIAHLHHQPCHVVYTDFRPTPLQHYMFPAGGDGLYLVVDENGNFKEENFIASMSNLKEGEGDSRNRTPAESNLFKIVKMIMDRNFAPVIIFSFSRRECEAYALQMSKLDFNTDEEKTLVQEVFNNAMDVLSEDDKMLPQVQNLLPLLKKGVGIHHSGLLPILKETIEILFGEGLIKALFATETFAMGLNMPARTVLFTSARKFDGKDHRWITSGEYIQMSGRAGRRGLDDRGTVILMIDEKMSHSTAKQIVKGDADPLNSAFHLTYNMVLNLLRVEEINPEYMLERSFHQFQNYAVLPALVEKMKRLNENIKEMKIEHEEEVRSYYKLREQLENLGQQVMSFIRNPLYLLPFLSPGRLVKVRNGDDVFGWGVVVNFQKKQQQKKLGIGEPPLYVAEVLLYLDKESVKLKDSSRIKPCPSDEKGEMQVVPILFDLIVQVSSIRLYLPQDLRPLDNRMGVLKCLQEVQKRFKDGLPLLDPIEDMGIKDKDFVSLVKKIEAFEHRLFTHPLKDSPQLTDLLAHFQEKVKLEAELQDCRTALKRSQSLLHMDELKCRKRVLRRLGYCTAADVIELKGRVACEISSGDELVLTEMLFNGVFNDLNVAQTLAVLSCLVFEEKANEMPKLSEELSAPLRVMQETARRVARVTKEAKLEVDEEEYVGKFRPYLMDVVYAWVNGATFGEIMKKTDIFEGSIIRGMRRLEELIREMCKAGKAIGNSNLENKFEEGIVKIKRDIVFAASLYL